MNVTLKECLWTCKVVSHPQMTSNPSGKQRGMKCTQGWSCFSHKGENTRAGAPYWGLSSQYKGSGSPVMDGSSWDARPLWGRVHSRGGTIWEQNVKAGPRVEIYAPTSGSNGCVWHSVDEVAMTAFLPSSPKGVHPFLSVGTSGEWRSSNNLRVKFFQPNHLPFCVCVCVSCSLNFKQYRKWHRQASILVAPGLSLCDCPARQSEADVKCSAKMCKNKMISFYVQQHA